MDARRNPFPICSNIPVPPKRREPKYYWDMEIIDEVAALRGTDVSRSWSALITGVLKECLTPDQLPHIDSHYRRVYERIKLLNLMGEF